MYKRVLGLVLFMLFFLVDNNYAYEIPEIIRVGLYYDSSSLNEFEISSNKKMKFIIKDDNGDEYIIYNRIGNFNISKDLNPNKYYIKCGSDFNTFSEAEVYSKYFNDNGVDSYILFSDNWQVCVGCYFATEDNAWTYISDNIIPKVGEGYYNVQSKDDEKKIVIKLDNKVEEVIICENRKLNISSESDIVKINDKNYRGYIEVNRLDGSDMNIVNGLSFDEYLYGVVPSEIQANSNMEALKAQAVAARTYAVSSIGKYSKYGFDVCPTTYCQVYKGYDYEYESTNNAVKLTSGEILIYDKKPAEVFYFSSSGGMTENVENVWVSRIPYLRSVEDKYESGNSTNYTWNVSLTKTDIRNKLKTYGIEIGSIKSLNVNERTDAGRVLKLDIIGDSGTKTIEKSKCRTYLGLYSQWYDIRTDADVSYLNKDIKGFLKDKKVVNASGEKTIKLNDVNIISANCTRTVKSETSTYNFDGRGFGHAVGMSQEGAKGMANNGFTYIEILKHYFTGVEIE